MGTKDFICSQQTFQDEDYERASQYYKKLKSIIPIIPSLGIY